MENLKKIIAEKDAIIDRMANDNQGRDGHISVLNDKVREKEMQIEAMLDKMDQMKKSLDTISFKHLEGQKLLDQMKSQDFAKQNLLLKR